MRLGEPKIRADRIEEYNRLKKYAGQALTQRERDILEKRFERFYTLDLIGEDHDRTRERVRQIINGALDKLRACRVRSLGGTIL